MFCSSDKIAKYLTKNWQNDNCSTRFFHNLPHQRFRTVSVPLNGMQVGRLFNLHKIFESSIDLFAFYEAFKIQLLENIFTQVRESFQYFLHDQLLVCNWTQTSNLRKVIQLLSAGYSRHFSMKSQGKAFDFLLTVCLSEMMPLGILLCLLQRFWSTLILIQTFDSEQVGGASLDAECSFNWVSASKCQVVLHVNQSRCLVKKNTGITKYDTLSRFWNHFKSSANILWQFHCCLKLTKKVF